MDQNVFIQFPVNGCVHGLQCLLYKQFCYEHSWAPAAGNGWQSCKAHAFFTSTDGTKPLSRGPHCPHLCAHLAS